MSRAVVVALLLLVGAVPAAAEPASPEERAAAIARPAVVFVQVDWHGWVRDARTGEVFGGAAGYAATSSCSGVVVAENGYVVTAAHCVDPGPAGGGGALIDLAVADLVELGRADDPERAAAALAAHAVVEGATPGSPVGRQVRVERVIGRSGTPERDVAPATVVDLVPPDDGDVALLRIPRTRVSAAEVLAEGELPAGTPILAIGFPAAAEAATDPGTEPTNKNGQISTRRTMSGSPYYEVSAAASPGMSGGPVVDMSGRVVGLISAMPKGETQSFNLVSASATVHALLADHRVDAGPSATDRNFVTGLDAYYAGDYPRAVEFFEAVLAATPTHHQAEEFRQRAAEHAPGGPDLRLVVILGCVGVAVLSAAAGWFLRRRRVADAPTPPYGFPAPVPPVAAPAPTPAAGLPAPVPPVTPLPIPVGPSSAGAVPVPVVDPVGEQPTEPRSSPTDVTRPTVDRGDE